MEVNVINEVKNLAVSADVMYVFGSFGIVLQSKVSNYGSGRKTVYTGYIADDIEANEGEDVEVPEEQKKFFTNWEITKIQKEVGYIANGCVKTLTDEEIESAVDKKLEKYYKAKNLLWINEVISDDIADAINNTLTNKKSALVEEYKQKRDERKNSLEKSEQAKKLQQLAKEIAEATKKGDFAKVMQLAQQQIALTTEDAEG